MLLIKAISLFAVIAAASPTIDTGRNIEQWEGDLDDGRETYTVYGNETDAAIFSDSDDAFESQAVEYKCYSGGATWLSKEVVMSRISWACDYLQGGYATDQIKYSCQRTDRDRHFEFWIQNYQSGRNHVHAHCVDRLGAIYNNCKYGGRVVRANWYLRADPQSGPNC